IDRGATSGTGVDVIHVYGFPIVNGSLGAGVFAGQGNYGSARTDVGAAYGSQFTNSGFWLYGTLPRGVYRLTAYAHSTVTGTFNDSAIADVIVNAQSQPLMSLD